ncbi:MAG: M18 family aminopeptidase, partial [Ilumatobacter sp.]
MTQSADLSAGPPGLADLISYLDASPSPWHCVASTVERLPAFTQLDEIAEWSDIPSRGLVVRDGALIAWVIPPEASATTGFRIGGAHTDSPGLRVKPKPDMAAAGWKQLGVEVYGGILNNTWLDRDLSVAGRVVDESGRSVLVDVKDPIARVPQLAVHLDRGVNEEGLKLDRQRHLQPVWGIGASTADEFAAWIGDRAGLDQAPNWWDLCLYDTQGAAVIGADRSMLTSARLDN